MSLKTTIVSFSFVIFFNTVVVNMFMYNRVPFEYRKPLKFQLEKFYAWEISQKFYVQIFQLI